MNTDKAEAPERSANIVTTTVRMSPDLHQRLADRVYEMGKGMPPRQRPSMDRVIQQAIERWLSEENSTQLSEAAPKGHLSHNSRDVESSAVHGPTPEVSPDRLLELLYQFKAEILEALARGRKPSHPKRGTRAGARKVG